MGTRALRETSPTKGPEKYDPNSQRAEALERAESGDEGSGLESGLFLWHVGGRGAAWCWAPLFWS